MKHVAADHLHVVQIVARRLRQLRESKRPKRRPRVKRLPKIDPEWMSTPPSR